LFACVNEFSALSVPLGLRVVKAEQQLVEPLIYAVIEEARIVTPIVLQCLARFGREA